MDWLVDWIRVNWLNTLGFITDGEDIICPDCAKDKLMGPG